MNSFGYTEDITKARSARAAASCCPRCRSRPSSPTAFGCTARFGWSATRWRSRPEVVVAFLMAQQEAVAALSQWTPARCRSSSRSTGSSMPSRAPRSSGTTCCSPAAGLAHRERRPRRARRLEVPGRQQGHRKAADLEAGEGRLHPDRAPGQAGVRTARQPSEAEFTRTDVGDLRGLPVWEMDRWAERS